MNQSPRRRPGRPALSPSGSTPLTVRMSVEVYDRLHRQATIERSTVPELMRRAARQLLEPDDDDGDDRD